MRTLRWRQPPASRSRRTVHEPSEAMIGLILNNPQELNGTEFPNSGQIGSHMNTLDSLRVLDWSKSAS